MNSQLPSKILIVDNDQHVLQSVSQGLQAYKVETLLAKDWETALYLFNNHKLDVCLVSLELSGLSGPSLIQKWREHTIESKRFTGIVLSTAQQRSNADAALVKELGDIVLISKPIKVPTLLSLLLQARQMAQGRQSLITLRDGHIEPLLRLKKFSRATEVAKEKLEPLGIGGEFESAKVHLRADSFDRAESLLKKLVSNDSSNMRYHNELARCYLSQGKLEQARQSYEHADQVAPKNLARLNDMAYLYLELNLPEQSISKFKEILELSPEKNDLKFDFYQAVADAGFEEHAQEFCKQTSTPTELIRHFNNKGVVFSRSQAYHDAIGEYNKALKLIPRSKEVYRILYNMAIAHINLKTRDDMIAAQRLLERSLELRPDFEKAQEKIKITRNYLKLD